MNDLAMDAELIAIRPADLSEYFDAPNAFLASLELNGAFQRRYWLRPADKHIIVDVEFKGQCQGPPGLVHGGLIAGIMDETMALVLWQLEGRFAVTGRLQVDFVMPAIFPATYRWEAWIQSNDAQSALVKARMIDARGQLYASASARFVWVALSGQVPDTKGKTPQR